MDVTLPNGVVIKGVPEGTGKHEIAMRAIKNGLATNKDFGYEEHQTDASFLEGVGAGMVDVGRKAVNLALPDALTPEFATDEAIARQKKLDEDLEEETSGFLGKLVGQVVGTLPVGGIGGGLAKGAAAARGASTGSKVLSRTLASPITRGAVEGAAAGSIISDPGERGEGTVLGAAIGGPLGALGQAAGKIGQKMKIVDIIPEAKILQGMTKHHIPLSQSAKPGLVRQIYTALLPNLPGVGGKSRAGYQAALDDFRRFVGEQAHPDTADIEILATDSVMDVFGKLTSYWKTAWDEIDRIPIGAFKKYYKEPPEFLEALIAKRTRGTVPLPKPGQMSTVGKVRELKQIIEQKIIPGENPTVQGQLREYVKSLDEMIEGNLKGLKNEEILTKFHKLDESFRNWEDMQTAAAYATNASFTPKQLEAAARRGKEGLDPEKHTVLQKTGALGTKALENFPSREGLFQSLAATAPVMTTLGSMAGGLSLPAAAAIYGGVVAGGRGMLRPGFERFISGQTNLMKEYAKALRGLGYTGRQVSAILGVDD